MKINKSIQKDRKAHANRAKKGKDIKPTIFECLTLYDRKWLQVEIVAKKVQNLAHDSHEFKPMAEKRSIQLIFEEIQNQNIIDVQGEILCLDSFSVKAYPNVAGARNSSGGAGFHQKLEF